MSVLDKPLFIPLTTKYFEQFAAGTKTTEYRKAGKRWNGNTCVVGRRVVLSKGYGKQNRLSGRLYACILRKGYRLREREQEAIEEIYGTLDLQIVCLFIDQIKPITINGEKYEDVV